MKRQRTPPLFPPAEVSDFAHKAITMVEDVCNGVCGGRLLKQWTPEGELTISVHWAPKKPAQEPQE